MMIAFPQGQNSMFGTMM